MIGAQEVIETQEAQGTKTEVEVDEQRVASLARQLVEVQSEIDKPVQENRREAKKERETILGFKNRLNRQIAMGLILLGGVAVGVTRINWAPMPDGILTVHRPTMSEQMALTAGYRAILF